MNDWDSIIIASLERKPQKRIQVLKGCFYNECRTNIIFLQTRYVFLYINMDLYTGMYMYCAVYS